MVAFIVLTIIFWVVVAIINGMMDYYEDSNSSFLFSMLYGFFIAAISGITISINVIRIYKAGFTEILNNNIGLCIVIALIYIVACIILGFILANECGDYIVGIVAQAATVIALIVTFNCAYKDMCKSHIQDVPFNVSYSQMELVEYSTKLADSKTIQDTYLYGSGKDGGEITYASSLDEWKVSIVSERYGYEACKIIEDNNEVPRIEITSYDRQLIINDKVLFEENKKLYTIYVPVGGACGNFAKDVEHIINDNDSNN